MRGDVVEIQGPLLPISGGDLERPHEPVKRWLRWEHCEKADVRQRNARHLAGTFG